MNTSSIHDPFDDVMAAALHGELSPVERMSFDERLKNDPAARAAYQEFQLMHDLLEKTHQSAQPDPAFEQRMISGVRRKLKSETREETSWESVLVLWAGLKRFFVRRRAWEYAGMCLILAVLAFAARGPIRTIYLVNGAQSDGIANPAAIPTLGDLPLVGKLFQSKADDFKRRNAGARLVAGEQNKNVFNVNGVKLAHKEADGSIDYGSQFQTDAEAADKAGKDLKKVVEEQGINYVATAQNGITLSGYVDTSSTMQFAGTAQPYDKGSGTTKADQGSVTLGGANAYTGGTSINSGTMASGGTLIASGTGTNADRNTPYIEPNVTTTPQGGTIRGSGFVPPTVTTRNGDAETVDVVREFPYPTRAFKTGKINETVVVRDGSTTVIGGLLHEDKQEVADAKPSGPQPQVLAKSGEQVVQETVRVIPPTKPASDSEVANPRQLIVAQNSNKPTTWDENWKAPGTAADPNSPKTGAEVTPDISRKLIRNAQLNLEVKSFPVAVDEITALTRAAGGYVDTSNSQKGGNGKLQGTVAVKVLPQNLEQFLFKLRDIGTIANQSVSTDDVTKDYYDTQARLDNSRKMEAQLQELLKRTNGKVSELLQVERELGRVRGEIEQMQGSLKLMDFQVQYATVTMQLREKDLNETAAYLLKEQDNFSLFATDVEGTFQKARSTAEGVKAQVLQANLNHNSGSDVAAELIVMVAPDQIEAFLAQVRGLGRVANFTRETQRVANDGGDSDAPADQTLTEKDKVQVHLSIRSDDETRKQVALTVVTPTVDTTFEAAKTAALAQAGAEILTSSLNKTPQGQATGRLTVRVPGREYQGLLDAFKGLGRTASFSLQRDDNSGPGANGDDAPVIVSLALTDTEMPSQETRLEVLTSGVDAEAQQLKKDAAAAGVEVKASSFARQPDGREMAQMVFRLPMAKYPAFLESLKKAGKVEALTVQRQDRPDQTQVDDAAPVQVILQLHNQGDIVPDQNGLWATLRETFGQGAGALFESIRVIGVLVAFVAPWVFMLGVSAWVGRRIYLWRKSKK